MLSTSAPELVWANVGSCDVAFVLLTLPCVAGTTTASSFAVPKQDFLATESFPEDLVRRHAKLLRLRCLRLSDRIRRQCMQEMILHTPLLFQRMLHPHTCLSDASLPNLRVNLQTQVVRDHPCISDCHCHASLPTT